MTHEGISSELIARLEGGDQHAFAELFSKYRERLKRMLRFRIDHRLRGREDDSDILQEVYIDAHQRITHYLKNPELSFYIWLRQLTTQRLIDVHRRHLKAEKRDIAREVSIDRRFINANSTSMAIQLIAQLTTPSQVAMRDEMLKQVETALDEIDPIDREVLSLRHFEELKNNEVAEALGIKVAAASNRYVRALTRLRSALEGIPGFFEEV